MRNSSGSATGSIPPGYSRAGLDSSWEREFDSLVGSSCELESETILSNRWTALSDRLPTEARRSEVDRRQSGTPVTGLIGAHEVPRPPSAVEGLDNPLNHLLRSLVTCPVVLIKVLVEEEVSVQILEEVGQQCRMDGYQQKS